jgi:hypothetical protein
MAIRVTLYGGPLDGAVLIVLDQSRVVRVPSDSSLSPAALPGIPYFPYLEYVFNPLTGHFEFKRKVV